MLLVVLFLDCYCEECSKQTIVKGENSNFCSRNAKAGEGITATKNTKVTILSCQFYSYWQVGTQSSIVTVTAGTLVVDESYFEDCGGIYVSCVHIRGDGTVNNTRFVRNRPSYRCGAAAFSGGVFDEWRAAYGTVGVYSADGVGQIENCEFDHNENGGVSVATGGSATLTECKFFDNMPRLGGGDDCSVSKPTFGAEYGRGGDICLDSG